MSVIRSCCLIVGIFAAAVPGSSSGQSSGSGLLRQQTSNRREIVRQAELAVLRQKVSMPLDRLVQPVSLAEWPSAATIAPAITTPVAVHSEAELPTKTTLAVSAVESDTAVASTEDASTNPFADDPTPEAGGKIPSGKLMGIVGRALYESAPVPSLEGLREHLPNMPIPAAGSPPPAVADEAINAESDFAPLDESDPFSEPAAAPAEAEGTEESATPEEDPFG